MFDSPLKFGLSISARGLIEDTCLAMIPGAVVGIWDVLHEDHGLTGGEEVYARLEQCLQPLQQVRSSIALLERKVAAYRLNLDKYQIAPALTLIESLYHDYDQALEKLIQGIREQSAGSPQGAADRFVSQGRLNGLASRVGEELGASLLTLQRMLSTSYAQYFLRPFQEDLNQRDFVSFFYLSKYCYARFFLAQVKAFLLLHLVQADACQQFRIQNDLDDFEVLLGRQEREMTHWLPDEVLALVEQLAQEREGMRGAVSVSWRSGLGDNGLRFGSDGGVHPCVEVQEWRLEPIGALVFNPQVDQLFRIKHAVSGNILQIGGAAGVMGVTDYKAVKDGWKISWNAAHEVFNLQFKSYTGDANNDVRLVSRSGPNRSMSEVRLDGKRVDHPYETEQQFFIEPYYQVFAGRDRMLVGEHLVPNGFVMSEGGAYTLLYRSNGSVMLVRGSDNKTVWIAAERHGRPPARLMLQPDGNLVAYDVDGAAYWSSGKYFKDQQALYKRSVLRVRKDGRVEIRVPGQEIFWITPQ